MKKPRARCKRSLGNDNGARVVRSGRVPPSPLSPSMTERYKDERTYTQNGVVRPTEIRNVIKVSPDPACRSFFLGQTDRPACSRVAKSLLLNHYPPQPPFPTPPLALLLIIPYSLGERVEVTTVMAVVVICIGNSGPRRKKRLVKVVTANAREIPSFSYTPFFFNFFHFSPGEPWHF